MGCCSRLRPSHKSFPLKTSTLPRRSGHTISCTCIPRWSHTVPESHVHRLLNNFYKFIKHLLKHRCHFSCRFHSPSLPSVSSPRGECLRLEEGQWLLGFTSWSQCKAHAALEPLGICRPLFEDWRFLCPPFLPLAMNNVSTDTRRSPSASSAVPSLHSPYHSKGWALPIWLKSQRNGFEAQFHGSELL